MTIQYARNVVAAGLLMLGAAAVRPAAAQSALPEQGGLITLVGCFQNGGPHTSKYVLANPTMGSIVSVPQGTCSDSPDEHAVELKDLRKVNKGTSILGHVVEISGRLEKLEGKIDVKDIRELHVRSVREVPVVLPKVAEAKINRPPEVEPLALPREESPVATSGTETAPLPAIANSELPASAKAELPKTASPVPLVGLIGLLLIGAAFTLRLFNPRAGEWR